VMQSDAIYYGRDLADYFRREFGDAAEPVIGPVRYIPFWSDLVERRSEPACFPGGDAKDGTGSAGPL